MAEYVNADWRDKLAAQQRHEHLAATVRPQGRFVTGRCSTSSPSS